MSRATRIVTAAVLALAIALFPAALDRCAATCDAHQDARAGTPACHHATAAVTRLGHVPTSCGHDHTGTTVASAKSAPPVERSSIGSMAVDVALPIPFAPGISARRVPGHAPPDRSLARDGRSLPLRI